MLGLVVLGSHWLLPKLWMQGPAHLGQPRSQQPGWAKDTGRMRFLIEVALISKLLFDLILVYL